MAEAKFLALDLGAESGRAFVGHFDGNSLRLEEIHRFPNGPVLVNGHLYWDALRLLSEIKTGIRLAVHKYGKGSALFLNMLYFWSEEWYMQQYSEPREA